MKLRIVQAVLAITMLVVVMLTPILTSASFWPAARQEADSWLPFDRHSLALAQDDDNDDEDNADNDDRDNSDGDNADNDDADNEDAENDEDNADNDDSDNEDGDNADNEDRDNEADNDDADNLDEPADNVDTDSASVSSPVYAFDPSVTEITGLSTGADARIALPGDRVVVQLFPWMPAGVTISVRLLDPLTVPPPGMLVGALVFEVAATDATGVPLAALPAEVNLSARYLDQEIGGLSEAGVILLWRDPFDQQWKPAPKLVANAATNYIAASVTGVGTYAVVVR
jgi:hypothetical protein